MHIIIVVCLCLTCLDAAVKQVVVGEDRQCFQHTFHIICIMKNQCVIQIIIMGTGIVVINLDKLSSGIDVFTVDPKKAFDRFELAVREF